MSSSPSLVYHHLFSFVKHRMGGAPGKTAYIPPSEIGYCGLRYPSLTFLDGSPNLSRTMLLEQSIYT